MRRLSGVLLAGVMLFAPAFSHGHGSAFAQQAAPPKLTFEGDFALLTVAIKPDKTADFEKIMSKLHEGLMKSEKAERKQQAMGWKLVKMAKPLPDGNIAYMHVINPVVPGADYTIMQTLYEEYPDERQALYDLYRGAFAANLSLVTANTVLDMSKPK